MGFALGWVLVLVALACPGKWETLIRKKGFESQKLRFEPHVFFFFFFF